MEEKSLDLRLTIAATAGNRTRINELLTQSPEADKGCASRHVFLVYISAFSGPEESKAITNEIEERCNPSEEDRYMLEMYKSIRHRDGLNSEQVGDATLTPFINRILEPAVIDGNNILLLGIFRKGLINKDVPGANELEAEIVEELIQLAFEYRQGDILGMLFSDLKRIGKPMIPESFVDNLQLKDQDAVETIEQAMQSAFSPEDYKEYLQLIVQFNNPELYRFMLDRVDLSSEDKMQLLSTVLDMQSVYREGTQEWDDLEKMIDIILPDINYSRFMEQYSSKLRGVGKNLANRRGITY